jgi:uncharacterized small protein (DUF1192 family)
MASGAPAAAPAGLEEAQSTLGEALERQQRIAALTEECQRKLAEL